MLSIPNFRDYIDLIGLTCFLLDCSLNMVAQYIFPRIYVEVGPDKQTAFRQDRLVYQGIEWWERKKGRRKMIHI